jgi:signal transduction histidine kinase
VNHGLGCFVLLLAWAFAAWAQPEDDADSLVAITSAALVQVGSATPAVIVELPVHQYRGQRELVQMQATSEFMLSAAPAKPWILYTEKLQDGGQLRLNGVLIADTPVTTQAVTVRQLRPLRFVIPPGVLQAGRNALVREWAVHENLLLLPRMWVGNTEQIDTLFIPRDTGYRVLPKITLVVAAVLAFIMFSIYWRSRDLKPYLWVAVSALGYCVVDMAFFVTAVPADFFALWQFIFYAAGGALTLGSYFFLVHASGMDSPRYRRWTSVTTVLHCAAFAAYSVWTGLTYAPLLTRIGIVLSAVFAAYPLWALARSLWRGFHWRRALLLWVAVGGIAVNVLDIATINGNRLGIESGFLLPPFMLVWFLTICAFLIADFSASIQAQQSLADQLAQELSAQRNELSRLHALERSAQEAQAATLERNRIMQDMHDGLGTQLVSSLAMARAGELSGPQTYELLRSCIDDLRLAIDTSQYAEDSLPLALGNLRFRMQPRLKAAGIALHWKTHALQSPLPLGPQQQLPVLRIIQESLTNALKHAHAKTIAVEATNTDSEFILSVQDDGRGFDVAAARAQAEGKGLNGLDQRARVLGAALQVKSGPLGTTVQLIVPFSHAGVVAP